MAYILGSRCGVAVSVGIVALLFKKKVLDMTFDERQERARGKAFQYGFFTLAVCVMVYGVLDSTGLRWCDTLVGCTICMCIGLTVFAITCIVNDAYLSLKEQPKKVMILFAVLTVFNLAIGAVYLTEGGLMKDGILTFRAVNPIIGIMTLVILAVYLVNYLQSQREEAE